MRDESEVLSGQIVFQNEFYSQRIIILLWMKIIQDELFSSVWMKIIQDELFSPVTYIRIIKFMYSFIDDFS